MSDLKITCPTCSSDIELTEQLAGPLMADQRAAFQAQLERQKAEMAKGMAEAEARAKAAAQAEAADEARALADRVKEQDVKLRAAQAAQAAAMKREQELKDKEAEMELTLQKMLAAERPALEERLAREAQEKASLKEAEQAQKIDALTKRIEDLQQRATQGSMQTQGEAAEMVLEDTLAQAFGMDGFSPVGKGQSGADVRQDVMGPSGAVGAILWESKRTKNFTAGWLPKLRDDQRSAGCEVAVLVTAALPDGIDSFGLVDGIWVCAPRYAVPLASSLRQGLIDVASAKGRAMGQETKMEMIYDYLTGVQFKQRVDAIVERFEDMQDNLRKERVFMEKQWALRAKQIDLVIGSTVGMYGDVQGIAGRSMPEINGVERLMIGQDPTSD
ncbi:DUF2130 domain-containing protein [Pseudooctadecabacter jejudonensis]|uniref:DUF2130 domain-containing protein n=1 Tax=Pseudooctadecabacter jejudonensis TaxID=1391910 RepID=A0A1Y5SNN3_9RHOB|nr:DUF2130 domain-containing protein [Pseudooctadecabacter jejudonensis]SLN44848.1 hypothetical protein PSJ8397_02334 [Pseudooctadecabacter jejudonensis]